MAVVGSSVLIGPGLSVVTCSSTFSGFSCYFMKEEKERSWGWLLKLNGHARAPRETKASFFFLFCCTGCVRIGVTQFSSCTDMITMTMLQVLLLEVKFEL